MAPRGVLATPEFPGGMLAMEEPAGRPRSISGSVEESPDSEGQGAEETQAGATSRRRNREQTAARGSLRAVRVKR